MRYLKHLKFGAYKSFQSLDVEFNRGLNIVIGPNGGGKSNLLNLVFELSAVLPEQLIRNLRDSFEATVSFVHDLGAYGTNDYKLRLSINPKSEYLRRKPDAGSSSIYDNFTEAFFDYVIQFDAPNGVKKYEKDQVGESQLYVRLFNNVIEYSSLFRHASLFSFGIAHDEAFLDFPSSLSSKAFKRPTWYNSRSYSFSNLIVGAGALATEELANARSKSFEDFNYEKIDITKFHDLLEKHLENTEESVSLKQTLSQITGIQDFRLSSNWSNTMVENKMILENLQFEFCINKDWVFWSHLSDGTKRLFLLISELLLAQNDIMLIEEPELGIHPHQLSRLMDFIKERSRHKQIILTTHSPQVLDILDKDELDSIILCEMTDKGSQLRHLADKEMKKAIHYMENDAFLSDYWRFSDLETV